jgi:hypothetical protein
VLSPPVVAASLSLQEIALSTLEAFLPLFEPEILGKLASKKAFAAGQELFDAGRTVSDIVFSGDSLRGKVKGSHPLPHTATLRLLLDGTLDASCSCPTFTDGWERICHHGVALALAVRKQYQTGAEITLTQNPWVQDVTSVATANQQRYQVEIRKGHWHVMVFKGGGTPVAGRKRYEGMSPADRIIQHYLNQEVDDCDDGGHVIDDAAFAGMLYFARAAARSASRASASCSSGRSRWSCGSRPRRGRTTRASCCTRSSSSARPDARSRSTAGG